MEGRGRREGAGTGRVSGLCHGPRERLRERHSESGRVSLSVSGSLSVFVRALGPETCECVRECAQVPQAPGRRAHAVCACRDATRELRVFARTARAGSDLRLRCVSFSTTPWLNYHVNYLNYHPPSRASALARGIQIYKRSRVYGELWRRGRGIKSTTLAPLAHSYRTLFSSWPSGTRRGRDTPRAALRPAPRGPLAPRPPPTGATEPAAGLRLAAVAACRSVGQAGWPPRAASRCCPAR